MTVLQQLQYLRALFAFAFRNSPLLPVGLVLSVVSVFLELAAMASLMPLATIVAGGSAPREAMVVRVLRFAGIDATGDRILQFFLLLFACRILTQLISQTLTIYLSRRMLLQLTSQAFSALIFDVPVKVLEQKSIGYFIGLAGDEASRASNLIAVISQFLTTALLAALYFAAIVSYSVVIAFAVLVFLAVTFLALFESFRVSHRLGVRQVEQSHSAGSLFLDALNGLRSVRSFSAEKYVTQSYYGQMHGYVRTLATIDAVALFARLGPALILLGSVAILSAWPAARESFSLDLPFLVTMIILLMRFFPIVGQGLNLALRVVADARAGRDVTQIIGQYQATSRAGSSRSNVGAIERIEAVDVHFQHLDGKPVLQGFNARFVKGRSYALIGVSGSGKSTFLDLLLGFFSPAKGAILVNGRSSDERSQGDLRGKIILVAQDAAIFNDTMESNLCLGIEASHTEVERACGIACIHEFIQEMPDGYRTILNYRGTNLSGGQKQRIGIARAVLRHPDVLLLDESTSALDAATREQVVGNLLKEFKDRIVVFVTHDAFVMSAVDEVLDLSLIRNDSTAVVPSVA
ncbi:ABC-type multidrug transport system, ATPase and permease component [Bradyrhizobium lablabi]|uniref:ABC-type multidrug transport system, ATPase and permease component n=1 Tax=Bradyrhizobium lablabi TaxID=722472 RepID=A0A1M7BGE8_9BRAD|nr:ABC transporter ATP-binding protein [Bradyrhizobium lablabi]SHL54060.1 ABC-type multidrug transport system, ATPase and permease component [Bradyrhizobium lablabi]